MASRFPVYREGGDHISLYSLDSWGGGLFVGFLKGGYMEPFLLFCFIVDFGFPKVGRIHFVLFEWWRLFVWTPLEFLGGGCEPVDSICV